MSIVSRALDIIADEAFKSSAQRKAVFAKKRKIEHYGNLAITSGGVNVVREDGKGVSRETAKQLRQPGSKLRKHIANVLRKARNTKDPSGYSRHGKFKASVKDASTKVANAMIEARRYGKRKILMKDVSLK